MRQTNQEKIEAMIKEETYKYISMLQKRGIDQSKMEDQLTETYAKRLKKILNHQQ